MELKECISFASENPVCYLATTEGDQPRVRGLIMDYADETGFYFATLSPKKLSKQLHTNPKVEVCFYNNASDLMQARMMRICGSVEFIDEPEALDRAISHREGLSEIVGEPVDSYVEIFKITAGDVHFWTIMDAMRERQLEHVEFN
jgi:pyridoxamine 5'-phosphate oxidase